MKLSDVDFFCSILKEHAGLLIPPTQSYIIESRVTPVAKAWGYPTIESLAIGLRGVPDKALLRAVVDAVISYDTIFLGAGTARDVLVDNVIPHFVNTHKKKEPFRLWNAVSGNGQETYSLAMLLKDNLPAGWPTEILATDISKDRIDVARRGIYSHSEVQRGLSVDQLLTHFKPVEKDWHIKNDIQKIIKFDAFNLMQDMAPLGTFHAIFCRHLLDCFDDATRTKVIDRLAAQLAPDGVLFLGDIIDSVQSDTIKPLAAAAPIFVCSDSAFPVDSFRQTA